MRFYTLDENRNPVPCSYEVWAYDLEHFEEYRRVALTTLGPYNVSTIFLGMDHNYFGKGPPILFETMIWSDKTTEREFTKHQWRYRTWSEAEEGHKAIVKLVEEGQLP